MQTQTPRIRQCLLLLAALFIAPQQADAQFFKKLFKKKKKAKVEQVAKSSAVDSLDALQTVMLDPTALADNSNNRNGFLGIPLGISADNFERQLLVKGFAEEQSEVKHTSKPYRYNGEVFGTKCNVALAVSDSTATVFAVDVEEPTVYPDLPAVRKRFGALRQQLVSVYGKGYVDRGGESYTIVTRLGTVVLHYERTSIGGGYMVGFDVDDAKAYHKAYGEMEDKEHETAPRILESGLAPACTHTDVVGLAVAVLEGGTMAKALQLLNTYEYATGRQKAKAARITGQFALDSYRSTAVVSRRGTAPAAVVITATDNTEQIEADLKTYGFSAKGRAFSNGRFTATVATDKQGRQVLTLRR